VSIIIKIGYALGIKHMSVGLRQSAAKIELVLLITLVTYLNTSVD
jgi:hypothetical protein